MTQVGVKKLTFGKISQFTPSKLLGKTLCESGNCKLPFSASDVTFEKREGGVLIEIPFSESEKIYGLGLQFKRVNHAGCKKTIKVNSDPACDTGDSHAPVPFYCSDGGYGVYFDFAGEITFYFGTARKKIVETRNNDADATDERQAEIRTDVASLYENKARGKCVTTAFLKGAEGADIYLFGGDSLIGTVEAYNMFSGGGALLPLYALAPLYRAYGGADENDVLALAKNIRSDGVPIGVFGLEPGWQSRSYPCSFVPDKTRFPHFEDTVKKLRETGYEVNLWEHAFVDTSSPIYEALQPLSADYTVWNGLVPDFSLEKTRTIFKDYHKRFIDCKISGFKLDECDDSDYSTGWSFPSFSEFPSGMNGEQTHSVFGATYARCFSEAYAEQNVRPFGQIRSMSALAASYPFVLYSDLYGFSDFLRGVVNCGFSGLLWTPEVRQCGSEEEFLRRLELCAVSPQCCINAWMIKNPPWKQTDIDKNNAGEFAENADALTQKCKEILQLRMSLIPYIYTAMAKYHTRGTPPFRALALAFENDEEAASREDEFMIGDDILAAPFNAENDCGRDVYLPAGDWFSLYDGTKYEGKKVYFFLRKDARMPLLVKSGSVVPFAEPVEFIDENTVFAIRPACYGDGGKCELIADDGISFDRDGGAYNLITITADGRRKTSVITESGGYDKKRYEIYAVQYIG